MTDAPAPAAPAAPDVYQMSPAQATAALAQKTAEYKTAQASAAGAVPPPPPGAAPTSAAQARARLTQLGADPAWRDRYLAGSPAEVHQAQELHAQAMAAGDMAPDVLIETVDSITDPHAVPRRVYDGLMDGLAERGMNADQEILFRQIDSGKAIANVTEGDATAARQALNKLMRNPELHALRLSGASTEYDATIFALQWAISQNPKDGRPMTQETRERLRELGLL